MTDLTPDYPGHLVDARELENFRTALDCGLMHGPWTRATCAAVLRTLDAAQAALDAERARREQLERSGVKLLTDGSLVVVPEDRLIRERLRAEAAEALNRSLKAALEKVRRELDLPEHIAEIVGAALAVLEEPQ